MLRGFIVGLIVGLAALAGLMVLFPSSVEAPVAPAAVTGGGAPAPESGATEEGPAGEPAPPEATEPEAETPAPAAPADQGSAPVEADTAVADAAKAETENSLAVEVATDPATKEAEGATRLPTVAKAADTLKAPVSDPEDMPAWRRNAVAFEAAADRPLLAIVLTSVPTGAGPNTPLSEIGAPVTLAVPARTQQDAEAARLYRRAGFETLLLLAFSPSPSGGIAPNLSDSEVAETVRKLIASFDSVVGLANPGAPKNPEMRVARLVMRELAAVGLGYLHAEGGAAGAEVRAANEAGVPMARNVRVIDAGLSVPEILKNLDLAAFDARRRGAAVAMGAPSEAMIAALIEWAKSNNGRAAQLAPFSAVLARLSRDG